MISLVPNSNATIFHASNSLGAEPSGVSSVSLIGSYEKPLKLSGLDIFSKFNRMTYSDILSGMYYDDIDAFNNQTIRTVVIKNWKYVEILYLLFLRLNTGSVKLSPQELRQALYPGKFIDYINSTAVESASLKRMLNIKKADFRMRDVEILIRYFAFYFYIYIIFFSLQYFSNRLQNSKRISSL